MSDQTLLSCGQIEMKGLSEKMSKIMKVEQLQRSAVNRVYRYKKKQIATRKAVTRQNLAS